MHDERERKRERDFGSHLGSFGHGERERKKERKLEERERKKERGKRERGKRMDPCDCLSGHCKNGPEKVCAHDSIFAAVLFSLFGGLRP